MTLYPPDNSSSNQWLIGKSPALGKNGTAKMTTTTSIAEEPALGGPLAAALQAPPGSTNVSMAPGSLVISQALPPRSASPYAVEFGGKDATNLVAPRQPSRGHASAYCLRFLWKIDWFPSSK